MMLCPDHLNWSLDAWILWLGPVAEVSMKEPIDIWLGVQRSSSRELILPCIRQGKEVLCMLVCPSLIMAWYSQASSPGLQERDVAQRRQNHLHL